LSGCLFNGFHDIADADLFSILEQAFPEVEKAKRLHTARTSEKA